jgi:hypothetical protein
MSAEIEIERALVASTGHICEETSEWLVRQVEGEATLPGDQYWPVSDHAFGWYVRLGEKQDWHSVPSDLQRLLAFADKYDCRLINLDCDGPEYEELPKYDW